MGLGVLVDLTQEPLCGLFCTFGGGPGVDATAAAAVGIEAILGELDQLIAEGGDELAWEVVDAAMAAEWGGVVVERRRRGGARGSLE